MGRRDDIVNNAYWWSAYGNFKASMADLRYICDTAVKPEQGRNAGMPTDDDLRKSLKEDYGIYFGTQIKQWCGIFCCMLLREAGLDVHWTLANLKQDPKHPEKTNWAVDQDATMTTAGHMYNSSGKYVELIWGRTGIQAGDVGIIPAANHHFLITGVDYAAKKYTTLEGNTTGQVIKTGLRSFSPTSAGQTIAAYYQIQG